jgi:hypothetical protein
MHDFEAEVRAVGPGTRHDTADGAEGPRSTVVGPRVASLLDLQRMAGNAGVVQLLKGEADEERSPVHDVVGGGGSSLDETTRTAMESRLGADFGDVRVHTDAQASRSAEAVGANAYTVGTDIVFRSGHFDPGSPTGQRTLAHELTHVLQQKSGPVDGTEAPGGIRLSDPGDRFERAADRQAEAAMAGSAPAPATMSPASAPTVQSESDETEDGKPLQRQAVEEDEEEEVAETG